VLDNHRFAGAGANASGTGANDNQDKDDVDFLRRYIHYCRSQCFPRLTEAAQERLAAFYVEIRGEVRRALTEAC
jgi:DNA replication licensing factor MCM5